VWVMTKLCIGYHSPEIHCEKQGSPGGARSYHLTASCNSRDLINTVNTKASANAVQYKVKLQLLLRQASKHWSVPHPEAVTATEQERHYRNQERVDELEQCDLGDGRALVACVLEKEAVVWNEVDEQNTQGRERHSQHSFQDGPLQAVQSLYTQLHTQAAAHTALKHFLLEVMDVPWRE
jgi:hypothetical protein